MPRPLYVKRFDEFLEELKKTAEYANLGTELTNLDCFRSFMNKIMAQFKFIEEVGYEDGEWKAMEAINVAYCDFKDCVCLKANLKTVSTFYTKISALLKGPKGYLMKIAADKLSLRRLLR